MRLHGEGLFAVVPTGDAQGPAPFRVIQGVRRSSHGVAPQIHHGAAAAPGQEMTEIGNHAVRPIDLAGGQCPRAPRLSVARRV
ncbi:MAG: hypothetical protein M3461_21615 [Pseudomonadota bacterium]|nr:hypothetical protein [Pseudomonadota bacterium]